MTAVATTNAPLWLQELLYPARIDRQLLYAMWVEGVVSGMGLRQRAEGANMSVDVLAGYGLVEGDDQAAQGSYLLSTDGKVNVPLNNGESNPRIDIIGLRVNDPQAGGGTGNSGSIEYFKGTAAATPSAPSIGNSTIELGRINVPANATSITNAMIDATQRHRSGPRSLSGALLALGDTPDGADYVRSPSLQQVSGDVGNLAFKLTERCLVRFDAHMTAYGTSGRAVLTYIKLNKGTAAISDTSAYIAFARGTFDVTGPTGAVSPRPWGIRVLDPGDYRCGFWCEGTAGYNFTVNRARDIPQLTIANMGVTSRPVTF